MKNIFLLLLLALLVALTFASPEAKAEPAPADYGPNKFGADWGKRLCATRAFNVQKAIERYCKPAGNTGGRYVPGARGSAGMRYGSAVVSINANCNPGQWLPWDICFKQFYSMCVQGLKGTGTRTYGRKNCQKWTITNK